MKSFYILIITTIISAMFFNGCGGSSREVRYNTRHSDSITIGVVFPTASKSVLRTHFSKGIEFAVNTVNKNGGVLGKPLSIVVRDDRNNANIAMQIAQTFAQQGITAVIGHWSTNISYYAQDIYEKNRVVMLTPRSTGLILFDEEFDYIFRMVGSNQVFAQAIAQRAYEKNYRNFAIYFSEDEFGTDLAKILERELNAKGIRVIDRVTSINPLNIDLIMNRWNAFGTDGVIMAASFPEYLNPIRAIRGRGSRLPIFGDDSFERIIPEDFPENYFDGLYVATLNPENLDAEFYKAFRAEFGHSPDAAAINGYEAVMLLAHAMEAVGSIDATAISAYLSNLENHRTVSGIRTYNPETQEFDGYSVHVIPLKPLIFGDL